MNTALRALLAGSALSLVGLCHEARAQAPIGSVALCIPTSSNNCPNVTASNGLPVAIISGGGNGGTASSFAAAFPATGTAIGVKNGLNMVFLTADGSNNLNVNCTVGCSGGSASNATSGQATSTTNGQTNAWLYGFNGTTWDQLQDDGAKNLKVNLATALPAGTNVIGHVITDSGTVIVTQATAANLNATVTGTITANAGTNLNTSALALESGGNLATLSGLVLALGSTTAGSKGDIALGAVTTAKPTYTTAQNNALSLDTNGLLRISWADTPANGTNLNVTVATALPAGSATIGKVQNVGNAGGIFDFAGQNAGQPANAILIGGEFNTSPTTITTGNASPFQLDSAANLLVNLKTAIPTGANVIGAVTQSAGPWSDNLTQVAGSAINTGHGTASGSVRVELPTDGTGVVGLNAGTNTIGNVGLAPQTSGGLSKSRTIVANNTTAIIIKASPGQLFSDRGYSIAATAPVFVKFYDATSQTCGVGSPVWEDVIPASGGVAGSGFVGSDANGLAFSTGIAVCITAGIADNDTTAPAASSYILDVAFK